MPSARLRPLFKQCRSICPAFKVKPLAWRDFRMEPRMTLMKAILGLCLGLALMAALQTVGVWSLQEHIKSQPNAGLPIGNQRTELLESKPVGQVQAVDRTQRSRMTIQEPKTWTGLPTSQHSCCPRR